MRPLDRGLLAVLTPIWLGALLLSVLSIERNAVVSPIRVQGASGPNTLPQVSDLPAWTLSGPRSVERGDALLRIGRVDARGASAARAVSLAWAEMQSDGGLALEVERAGEVLDVEARIPATIPKWPPLLVSAFYGSFAVLGLWRFPALRVTQVAFPALMATAIFLGSHFGTRPQEILSAFALRAGALLFLQPLTVRLLRYFPRGDASRSKWARYWPWLLGLNGLLLLDTTLFDTLPDLVQELGEKIFTVGAAAVVLAVGIDRYRHSNRDERRRFKWLLLAMLVASMPGATVAFVAAFRPEFGAYFLPSQLAQLVIPIGLWIAITRHQLFDIDRLLNVASVALASAALFVGAALAFGPQVRDAFAKASGFSESSASIVIALLAAALLLPAAAALRKRLDAWTLREAKQREGEVRRLLDEISASKKLRELIDLVTQQVPVIWKARGAALWFEDRGSVQGAARVGEHPAALSKREEGAASSMRRLHEAGRATRGEELGASQGEALFGHLLAPVRAGVHFKAALSLAPSRSGDAYDAHDAALLTQISERMSARVTALEQQDLIDQVQLLNRELAEGKEEAERASEEKTHMLAAASHDLRQPLQALRLFLGTLEGRVEDPEQRALLDKAQVSAIAMQQMFESLLDSTRLEAGKLEVRLQRVVLSDLFGELEAFLSPLAREKGLAFEVDAAGLAVQSDPALLRSMLQNLLSNAIRYTDRGKVQLRACEEENAIRIEVRDSGRGISEDEQARLFEAWRRGASADGDPQGSGLGLSIVSRLAELLGHEVSLRSSVGAGATFSLRLEGSALAHDAPLAAATAEPLALRGARVFVIDDEPREREGLQRLLEAWGLEVHCAASASELLGAAPPNALLLDYRLQGETSGLDALRELEAHFGPCPAAIISGESDPAIAEEVRSQGLSFLNKPAAPVQIRAVLTSLLAPSPREDAMPGNSEA